MLRIDVVTIFPELFDAFLRTSIVGIAREAGALEVTTHDLRGFTIDRRRARLRH